MLTIFLHVGFTLDLLSAISPIKLTTTVTFYVIICFRNVNSLFSNFLHNPLKPLEIYSNLLGYYCSFVKHKTPINSRSLKFWPIRVEKTQTADTANHLVMNSCKYLYYQKNRRIEMRTRIVVFTNRQYKRGNGRLSVNSLTVIQINAKQVF